MAKILGLENQNLWQKFSSFMTDFELEMKILL